MQPPIVPIVGEKLAIVLLTSPDDRPGNVPAQYPTVCRNIWVTDTMASAFASTPLSTRRVAREEMHGAEVGLTTLWMAYRNVRGKAAEGPVGPLPVFSVPGRPGAVARSGRAGALALEPLSRAPVDYPLSRSYGGRSQDADGGGRYELARNFSALSAKS